MSGEKLRILFVSSSSGSQGGGELYLLYLGEALSQRGHEVILWASDHGRMDELCVTFAKFGQVVRAAYSNTYDYPLRAIQHMPSLVRRHKDLADSWNALKPDVIHLNKQCLEDGLDLLVAADYQTTPHLAFLHITQSASYLKAKHAGPRDWISRILLNRYTGPIISHSNRIAQLREFLGRPPGDRKIFSIDNGVRTPTDTEYIKTRTAGREMLNLSPNDFLILGVGRLENQKRPDRFREMALKLHKKIPGSRVVWVGAGRLEDEWDAWVDTNRMKQVFTRTGWQRDVFPYLAAADIYIHPASYEGMPFSLLEAMAWQKCCVIMRELANELEYFTDENAIVADEGLDDWIDAANDVAERARTAEDARQLVNDRFSLEHMAERYEAAYVKHIEACRTEVPEAGK